MAAPLSLLYQVAHENLSGICLVRPPSTSASLRVLFNEGWVHAIDLSARIAATDTPARGPDALSRLFDLIDATSDATFAAEAPSDFDRRYRYAPFHPARVLRDRAAKRASDWRARIGLGSIVLPTPPHASAIDADERPLVAFLSRPRSGHEIDDAALCPPTRAERLISELDVLGAIRFCALVATPSSPFSVLSLAESSSLDEVKRAFRTLARSLHPDLHPGVEASERHRLEARFSEIAAAYRAIIKERT